MDKLNVPRAIESIISAQNKGAWPMRPMRDGSFDKGNAPPFVESVPKNPPTRTHEDAMIAFHKIQNEYQERQSQTNEQAITAPQIEQTPTPVIAEKRNIFKRFFARILGKS